MPDEPKSVNVAKRRQKYLERMLARKFGNPTQNSRGGGDNSTNNISKNPNGTGNQQQQSISPVIVASMLHEMDRADKEDVISIRII